MNGIVCARCAHRNALGSNFCSSCGFELSAHGDDTATLMLDAYDGGEEPHAIEDQAAAVDERAVLVVTRGPNVGSRIPLGARPLTAGRHPESDLFLDDVTVSRRHAEVSLTEAGYQVPRCRFAQRHLREPSAC